MPPESTIAAGDLDTLVGLLSPVYNADSDEIESWTDAGRAWASVVPQFATEATEGSRDIEMVLIVVTIRYRAGMDARWRIQNGTHTYEIKGIQNVANRSIQLRLNCQEVL